LEEICISGAKKVFTSISMTDFKNLTRLEAKFIDSMSLGILPQSLNTLKLYCIKSFGEIVGIIDSQRIVLMSDRCGGFCDFTKNVSHLCLALPPLEWFVYKGPFWTQSLRFYQSPDAESFEKITEQLFPELRRLKFNILYKGLKSDPGEMIVMLLKRKTKLEYFSCKIEGNKELCDKIELADIPGISIKRFGDIFEIERLNTNRIA
jgi:hypothetical protein